jgi:uncharacterized lipoprotein YmbA
MKPWLMLLFTLLFTACTSPATPTNQLGKLSYPDLGLAPKLAGEVWINSDTPLRLADLRGKVVLLDMWTFG